MESFSILGKMTSWENQNSRRIKEKHYFVGNLENGFEKIDRAARRRQLA
ncbi:MAG: hypothetical protein ABSA13_09235 [Beijerinckiaceae bacterium]